MTMTKEEMLEVAKKIWGEHLGLGHKSCAPVGIVKDLRDYSAQADLTPEMYAYTSAIEEKYQAENERLLMANRDVKDWSDAAEADLKAAQKQIAMLRDALKEIEKLEGRKLYETCPDCDGENCSTEKQCKYKSAIQKIAQKAITVTQSTDAFIAEVKAGAVLDFLESQMSRDYSKWPNQDFAFMLPEFFHRLRAEYANEVCMAAELRNQDKQPCTCDGRCDGFCLTKEGGK